MKDKDTHVIKDRKTGRKIKVNSYPGNTHIYRKTVDDSNNNEDFYKNWEDDRI